MTRKNIKSWRDFDREEDIILDQVFQVEDNDEVVSYKVEEDAVNNFSNVEKGGLQSQRECKFSKIEIDFTSSWFIFSIFWFFLCVYNLINDNVEHLILTLGWVLISLIFRIFLGKKKDIYSILIGFVSNLVIWYVFEYLTDYLKKENKENNL